MKRYCYFSKLFYLIFLIAIFQIFQQDAYGTDYNLHPNPISYLITKFQPNDLIFLGTRHKQPPILNFVSNLIAALLDSGVTHIGLEIASDQQDGIDHFISTGAGLNTIQVHPQMDCPEYRNLFHVIRELEPDKRPVPVALDLPKSRYAENISRDEWMARSIAGTFATNPNAKMLVVIGNNHVLKRLDWQDSVINQHRSIREYLSEKRGKLRMASIGQVIGDSVYEDDFRREFAQIDGAVAVNLNERFVGWKSGIVQSMAIREAEVWVLLDGLVVY